MVESVAVTPDSEFAHASLLARARPKDRHRAGFRLARGEPRKGLCPPKPSRRSPMSVRVSDGGGSPPTFTVAMLALTPDAVDVHPFSVALLDVARVAAGLGHFSGASGAACDAMLVDVTVRSEEHTSELQSPCNLVCRLLLEKKKTHTNHTPRPLTTDGALL